MGETLFVQFYSYNTGEWPPNYEFTDGKYLQADWQYYFLGNGFSSVYQECKKHGDFLWIKCDLNGTLDDILEKNKDIELPVTKGTVYVSAFFNAHLNLSYIWARRYPNIQFVVGGPAVRCSGFISEAKGLLPDNLNFKTMEAETLFDKKEEGEWGIDFPSEAHGMKFFGYTITSRCYWNKCIFCNYDAGREIRRTFNSSFVDSIPKSNFPSIIHLNTPSASPRLLEQLPELTQKEDHNLYWIFLRADRNVKKTLERILPKCHNPERLMFFMGLEFPSNRMLEFIKKGFSLEDYLEQYRIIKAYNGMTLSAIILGWNNLIPEDIDHATDFFESLRSISKDTTISLQRLFVSKNGTLYKGDFFKKNKKQPLHVGPFEVGYIPLLDDEQMELNNAIAEMSYQYEFKNIRDTFSNEKFWGTNAG